MSIMWFWRILSGCYHRMNYDEPNLNIGLNPKLAVDDTHGRAYVKTDDSPVLQRVPFRVDKPRFLYKPGKLTISRLCSQFEKLGLECERFELRFKDSISLYDAKTGSVLKTIPTL